MINAVRPVPLPQPMPLGAWVTVGGEEGWRIVGVYAYRSDRAGMPADVAAVLGIMPGVEPSRQVMLTVARDSAWFANRQEHT